MKWLKNIESLSECGKVGPCPFCGSNDTSYNAKKVNGNMGYVVIWCNECKKSHVISRANITEKMNNGDVGSFSNFV